MKFEIKHKWSGAVLFECEAFSIRLALEAAVSKGAYLTGADLTGAYLTGADLKGAYLTGAYLKGAYLTGAYLKGAYLKGAYLTGADLTGAYLKGADLTGADLTGIKKDFLDKLLKLKSEAVFLYKALVDGRVNGSIYEGECACFCGTLANSKGIKLAELEQFGIKADSGSPVERWFLGIAKGDTPQGNQISEITVEWMTEFMNKHEIAIPTREVIWK